MRLDALAELDLAANLSATAYSQNVIDLTSMPVALDLGTGEPLEVAVTVDVSADFTTGDETYEFDFVQSVNPNLGNEDALLKMVVPASALTAGSIVHVPVPKNMITKRYVGLKYVLGGTTPSITVSSHMIPQTFAEQNVNYPTGFQVS
jgi:hypothetical protein